MIATVIYTLIIRFSWRAEHGYIVAQNKTKQNAKNVIKSRSMFTISESAVEMQNSIQNIKM